MSDKEATVRRLIEVAAGIAEGLIGSAHAAEILLEVQEKVAARDVAPLPDAGRPVLH